jgi:hypothetical protein
MYTGDRVIKASEQNETLIMPELVKNYTAGLDWAGNTGKLIANLLLKKDAFGETFSVSSGQNLTWGQVADIYQKLVGVKIKWDTEDAFLDFNPILKDVLLATTLNTNSAEPPNIARVNESIILQIQFYFLLKFQ